MSELMDFHSKISEYMLSCLNKKKKKKKYLLINCIILNPYMPFGQIWPVLTFNSNKNTLNVIFLAWNMMT